MYSVPPGIPKRLDLLRLTSNVANIAILHITTGGGPLKVGVELDAVGWVEIDTLHLAPQPFSLGQRRHNLQAVTQDHPVGPMSIVLIKFGLGALAGDSVKIGEKIELSFG